jgi:hypothetical protein
VLIKLSSQAGKTGFDATAIFDDLCEHNKKKIAITTFVGDVETQNYVEIEYWDQANEVAFLWTKVPTVSSGTDTVLYLYYDSTHTTNSGYVGDITETPAQNVWNDNFVGVWHMCQDPAGDVADSIKDSKSGGYHGTPAGTMTSEDLVDGKISKAIDFDGGDDRLIISDNAVFRGLSEITVELYVNADTKGDWEKLLDYSSAASQNADRKYRFQFNNDADQDLTFVLWNDADDAIGATSINAFTSGSYRYVVGVYDGTNNADAIRIYDNSALSSSVAGTGDTINNASAGDLWFGAEQWTGPRNIYDGKIDEIRISKVARSGAWIEATYYSNEDSLITFDLETFTFSGDVYVDGTATSGIEVRLYRRATGKLVGEYTTTASGLFQIDSPYYEDHFCVAMSDWADTNSLIYDWVTVSG